jgi:hypothetical protein
MSQIFVVHRLILSPACSELLQRSPRGAPQRRVAQDEVDSDRRPKWAATTPFGERRTGRVPAHPSERVSNRSHNRRTIPPTVN